MKHDEYTTLYGASRPQCSTEDDVSGTVWVAYRIEDHPDREMTFLGVFTSEEKAQEACDRHCATKSYHRDWEYTVRECALDRRED